MLPFHVVLVTKTRLLRAQPVKVPVGQPHADDWDCDDWCQPGGHVTAQTVMLALALQKGSHVACGPLGLPQLPEQVTALGK
ncbi:MAG: hypothetical protein DYH12_02600 [Sorangiineae bacterium PRO1]|nr:hypothetical protein [Sorangiineae bacterium PRO1]